MYKILIYFLVFSSSLLAYIDSDMDGVIDKNDKCKNTLLTDLVDLSGCSVKSLVSFQHFDILLGKSYSTDKSSNLTLSSITLDYYYKVWSLQLSSSFYEISANRQISMGMNDTYVNISYLFQAFENFYLKFTGGIVFPTYNSNDNNIDYSTSLYGRYTRDKFSFIVEFGYGKIGDRNKDNIVSYNNTFSYSTSIGYTWNKKLYTSISYNQSNSVFKGSDNLKILSLYGYYSINQHWFSTINYRHGFLSVGSRKSVGVNIGYYW